MKRSFDQQNQSSKRVHSSAKNRLLRDLSELHLNPLETVHAEPLEHDIFTWYVTILAPPSSLYHGIILHLSMVFSEDYPNKPPSVKALTPIHHSHVHGDWVCLDMLQTHNSGNFAWSSSYSVLSILLQLQSFLLEEEQAQLRHIEGDIKKSREFKHEEVGHCPRKGMIWPMAPHWNTKEILESGGKFAIYLMGNKLDATSHREVAVPSVKVPLSTLPNEILHHMMQFLPFRELFIVETLRGEVTEISRKLQISNQLVCFHSKLTFKEDTLGVGISMSSEKLLSSPIDLMAGRCFYRDHVRRGVWGETYRWFLPVFINRAHGNDKLFEECVDEICRDVPLSTATDRSMRTIELLSKLMNSMIVEIMQGAKHASIKALHGYCYFHRWMIHIVEKNPGIMAELTERVQRFVNEEKARSKKACPNIGEFLQVLAVLGPCGITWDFIKQALVEETTVRNVLWVAKQFPHLADPNDDNDIDRVNSSWNCNLVSSKLIMFQVFFLRNVVEKKKSAKGHL